jgi:hypothetical protein
VNTRASTRLEPLVPRPSSHAWWVIGVVVVALISVYVRILTATPIEDGGDAIGKWQYSHLILTDVVAGPHLYHSHHFLRWAVNFPNAAVQAIFGYSVQTYYVGAILFATIAACFTFLLGLRAQRWLAGLAAALVFIFATEMYRGGSQDLPEIYSVAYVLIAVWLLDKHAETRQLYLVVLAALFLFFAYGAKEWYVALAVPMALFIFFCCGRDLKGVILFFVVLAVLFAAETLILAYLTGEFRLLGRVELMSERALRVRFSRPQDIYEWNDLFLRWETLPVFWRYQVLAGIAAALFYVGAYITGFNREPTTFLVSITLIWFCAVATFAVIDTDPLRFLMNLRQRYLIITIPLSGLAAFFLFWDAVVALIATSGKIIGRAYTAHKSNAYNIEAMTAAIVFSIVSAYLVLVLANSRDVHRGITESNILRMKQLQEDVITYYERNYAVAFSKWQTLIVAQNVLLKRPYDLENPSSFIFLRFDGKNVSYFNRLAPKHELSPETQERLADLFKGDACVSGQRSESRDGSVYFIAREPEAVERIAFFGNPLTAQERKRGATCFDGMPGPLPLSPAPKPQNDREPLRSPIPLPTQAR